MKTIFKYLIEPPITTVDVPPGAQVLSVGVQETNQLFVWILLDEKQPKTEKLRFFPVATGGFLDQDDAVFVGTVFIRWMVFHIFCVRKDIAESSKER